MLIKAPHALAIGRSRSAQHPFHLGSCEVLPIPRETLLVRLEVRNALADLVAL